MPSEGKTAVPRLILDLVERFERNREAYKSGNYNETQVRREFLDPFFKALGWDIDNEQGYAEAYKDVVHEDAIKIGDGTRAPDYCFRIGGARKFFLEAKRPSIDIKNDAMPAFQLRRYAWTSKLPLSILTDFEEFAVYDCRVKPDQKDKASVARILYIPFTEYATRWDEIAGVFSRDAVLKGSFDKYAEENKAKRGTAAVDDAFLQTIESWRKALAENLALRNKKLTQRETNFAVQRIIDRIIFLRICEGRGIEDYGKLRALADQDGIYPRLGQLFKEADDRYNSGLFHFKAEKGRHEPPDQLTLSLDLDDKLLRGILKGLYYPESPYVFSALPADVLGQVYEQFLGKVIRLTEGHHAKVEDKPEVKKAGGVYYTPTYIVEYIVENTVGKLLEDKTLKQAAALRILDPACGSGSFLLGAYEYLLQWHLKFYTDNDPAKWARGSKPALVQASGGGWKLTIAERKRILLANIYGVDIDAQAVETTKLSLLLKVLEGETQQSLQPVLVTLQERALPDLGDNIKCGNSLIGSDFYQQQLLPLDEEDRYRINVFDWNKEFSDIVKAGGFDALIGNPPYVRQESLSDFKSYFEQEYEAFDSGADLYTYFMEKGLGLLRPGGLFSIIVSSSFLRTTYAEPLRRTLKKHAAVVRIVDFGGLAVFANAKDTYVCIPLLVKGEKQSRVDISKVGSLSIRRLSQHVASNHFSISQERLTPEAWSLKSDAEAAVFEKVLKAGKPLGEYVNHKFFRGVLTGLNEAFEITAKQQEALTATHPTSKSLIKRFLGGQDIRRYIVNDVERFLIVVPCGWTRQQMMKTKQSVANFSEREAWNWFCSEYPAFADHLKPFMGALRKRDDQGDYWWELRPCDYYNYFDTPKIIFPDICKGPRFHLDCTGIYLANTAYCLGTEDRYLLGLLNSRLFWFAISHISIPFGIRAGEYRYRLIYQYMEKVPIRVIDDSNKADQTRHDKIVKLVDQTLDLHKNLAAAKTPQERTSLERQIAATDAQIDRLVYELYGLTPEEIKIVEASTAAK
ncbi:MAG TPA: N-6 DNA methylase [Candidatus Angelobacter sp.]|jgi:type I restriction-modification system DNA methylase subunit